jgi:hypothetical protein
MNLNRLLEYLFFFNFVAESGYRLHWSQPKTKRTVLRYCFCKWLGRTYVHSQNQYNYNLKTKIFNLSLY